MVSAAFQEHRTGAASIEVPKFVRELLKKAGTLVLALVAGSLLAQNARADFDLDLSEEKLPHRLTITSHALPNRDVGNGGGSFGERDLSFKGSLEISKDVKVDQGKASVTQFSVQPLLDRRQLTGLGFLNRDATLYSEGVSLGAFHMSQSKEVYFFGAGISHSGETGPSGGSLWDPSAYAAGTYHFNEDTALIYGAAFSTSLGYFFPVPVLGLMSQLSPDWSFMTILPILTEFRWKPVDQWSFTGFLRASGFESSIANNQSFGTSDSSVKIKARAFELGVGAGYEISSNFLVRGDLGTLAARQLKYEDGNGTLMIQNLNAAPVMLTLSATARFGSAQ